MDKSNDWYLAEALEALAELYERNASPLARERAAALRRKAVDVGLRALARDRYRRTDPERAILRGV